MFGSLILERCDVAASRDANQDGVASSVGGVIAIELFSEVVDINPNV
jgi:hypothetical protein